MRLLGRIGRPPSLRHHMTVAQEHEAVQGVDPLLGRPHEGEEGRRRDPLLLRGAAGEGRRVGPADRDKQGKEGGDSERGHGAAGFGGWGH